MLNLQLYAIAVSVPCSELAQAYRCRQHRGRKIHGWDVLMMVVFGLIIGHNRVKPCWLSRFGIPQHASLVYGCEPIYPIPHTDHSRKGESNSEISIFMYVDHLHLLGRCSARRSQNEQFELELLQASRAEDAFVTHIRRGPSHRNPDMQASARCADLQKPPLFVIVLGYGP
jgi:hypothetical protein